MNAINFYTVTESAESWIGREHFRHGFTTSEVERRCTVMARVAGVAVVGRRSDGFACGMGFAS
jgi:hypothetical protein